MYKQKIVLTKYYVIGEHKEQAVLVAVVLILRDPYNES